MKIKMLTLGAALLLILGSCRQKTTKDGTMVDRENGYSEEQHDNQGGQAQSQDTTATPMFDATTDSVQ